MTGYRGNMAYAAELGLDTGQRKQLNFVNVDSIIAYKVVIA